MTTPEPKAFLTNLLHEAGEACRIAKTALRAKQSLKGDGNYARKFHEAVIALTTTEGKLRPALACLDLAAGETDAFNRDLSVLKSDDAKPNARAAALKGLELLCRSVVVPKIEGMTASPVPATEQVLPMAVVHKTRGYLEKIVIQANGNYEHRWYDACSVMVRKLVENLIILAFEGHGEAAEIKDGDSFLMLGGLIKAALKKDASWHLHKDTKRTFELVQALGNRAAHERHHMAQQQDIDNVRVPLRMAVDDLLHHGGLR